MKWIRGLLHPLTETVRYYAVGLYRRFGEEDILLLSAGIAFNGIMCLLPFLLLLTWLVGVLLHSSELGLQKVDEILESVFPAQPYAEDIKKAIKGVIDDIIEYRSTFGLFGAVTLLWTTASLFSSVRSVINRIYRVTSSKLLVLNILENLVLVVILGILFFVANAYSWMISLVESLVSGIPILQDLHIEVLARSVPFVTAFVPAFAMFFIVSRFIPDGGVPSKVAFVAAFTTSSLWWIAGEAFGWYLSSFPSYSRLYNTYAFLLVFLVWVYYSSVVFVVGVVVGQLYRERLFLRF